MPTQNYMHRLRLDDAELKSRRAFFEIADSDLARLASLRPFAEAHTNDVIEDLYVLILGHPESRKAFRDEKVVAHVKMQQKQYFLGLFSGRCDLAYVEDRLRIGLAHERVGIPPKWYIGAYSRYRRLIFDRLAAEQRDPVKLHEAYSSIEKLTAFDMALAMDTYITAHVDAIARHQAAIRELSTPVIRIHRGVLLMPLIGTVDTQRAEQIMETVLQRVVEEQASVMILDIAGIPVVDTQVAEHLLKTTAAVRLLGAETILTGISPILAKTIVRLGIDVSSMHTRSRLDDGVTLALDFVGKEIRAHEETGSGRKGGERG